MEARITLTYVNVFGRPTGTAWTEDITVRSEELAKKDAQAYVDIRNANRARTERRIIVTKVEMIREVQTVMLDACEDDGMYPADRTATINNQTVDFAEIERRTMSQLGLSQHLHDALTYGTATGRISSADSCDPAVPEKRKSVDTDWDKRELKNSHDVPPENPNPFFTRSADPSPESTRDLRHHHDFSPPPSAPSHSHHDYSPSPSSSSDGNNSYSSSNDSSSDSSSSSSDSGSSSSCD